MIILEKNRKRYSVENVYGTTRYEEKEDVREEIIIKLKVFIIEEEEEELKKSTKEKNV